MAQITLITGGGRSGKSAHALQLAEPYDRKFFIATAEAFDDEMRTRIARHRAERGPEWQTIEEPLDLASALAQANAPDAAVVIDCLTVWLGNLMFHDEAITENAPPIAGFIKALQSSTAAHILLVTNEVGMGIIPADPQTRRWRDLAGRLNQYVAAQADRVILMVCGQPLVIKPSRPA
jgi:adenosyl cobinamide kinase/adenosyl cobinamide phosphate guanylyltransferase